jgi:hypothetical protein
VSVLESDVIDADEDEDVVEVEDNLSEDVSITSCTQSTTWV